MNEPSYVVGTRCRVYWRVPSRVATDGGFPRRSLSELSGSGDRITVEAVVNEVVWMLEGSRRGPNAKGSLTTEDSSETAAFVFANGVALPDHFEEGRKFEFRGVTDHYYQKKDHVQVLVTPQADVVDKGVAWRPPPEKNSASRGRSRRKRRSGRSRKSKSNSKAADMDSLHRIADDVFGGDEGVDGDDS